MLKITINKKTIRFSDKLSGTELLKKIFSNEIDQYIAMEINGKITDLSTIIANDCEIRFISIDSPESIDIIRLDAKYILAQAVKELFPAAITVMGNITKDNFYYDFANIGPFCDESLKIIEKKMSSIIKKDLPILKKIFTKQESIKFFQLRGEKYKIEIINTFIDSENITVYSERNFSDLSKGPHSPSTKFVKVFKLIETSGAYWKGNSKNTMLQRIYGVAFSNKKQLSNYLERVEELKKRDHRRLGRECELFHFQKEAQGLVFWHPKGWDLFQRLVNYIRNKQNDDRYYEISTPEIMDQSLWEASGHWDKFRDSMLTTQILNKDKVLALRPMNCPGSIQIYKQKVHSYKNLPLRLSEFGKVYRFEPSGSLYGLMRARSFTQDDAHIFCRDDQITVECIKICELITKAYKDFGFMDIKVKLSNRPNERIGSNEVWDKSENALIDATKKQGLSYIINEGEGAFYGPKLEFILKDAIGREWQLGTIQVDFNLPERFNMCYINNHGNKCKPVILHRALFGSIERFLGILLEHYSGNIPIWLAPTQVLIASITDDIISYGEYILKILENNGIRCGMDFTNEKINYKIKRACVNKTPLIVILGKKEKRNKLVSIRKLGNKDQETLELSHFIDKLLDDIKYKRS